MPKETDTSEEAPEIDDERVLSPFGIASAVLGLVCVVAIVLTTIIWNTHRNRDDELAYQGRVVQTAVEWANVLINMNKDNIDGSLAQLRDGTVGDLNVNFDSVVAPFGVLIKRLQRQASGNLDSFVLETAYHDLDRQPGGPPPPRPLPEGVAARTDFVLVIGRSQGVNAGAKPDTQVWNLRIGISDVDGKLLVSTFRKYG